jgi:hypothetical protein
VGVPIIGLGENHQFTVNRAANSAAAVQTTLKNNDILQLARPLHLLLASVQWVDRQELLKGLPMFTSFTTARETATVFAGALITALLFVSAATSLPIA